MKMRNKFTKESKLEISGTRFWAPLTGIGLITAIGKREILDTILADHGLVARILIEASIK